MNKLTRLSSVSKQVAEQSPSRTLVILQYYGWPDSSQKSGSVCAHRYFLCFVCINALSFAPEHLICRRKSSNSPADIFPVRYPPRKNCSSLYRRRVASCGQLRIVLSCLRKPASPQFRLSLAHMVFLHFGKNLPRISSSVKYAQIPDGSTRPRVRWQAGAEKTAQMCDSVISL